MSDIRKDAWQHNDGAVDADFSLEDHQLRNVLIEPRPWPKLTGAAWFVILFGGEIALMLGAWLVTK